MGKASRCHLYWIDIWCRRWDTQWRLFWQGADKRRANGMRRKKQSKIFRGATRCKFEMINLSKIKWDWAMRRSNVHSEQTWRQGIHIRIVFIAFWRRKQKKAIIAGVTTESFDHLRELLFKYHDVFHVNFATDPPVKLEPLNVRCKEVSTPIMAISRRYPPVHREYMETHLSKLTEHDLIYRSPDSRWGSVPHIVGNK